MSVMDQLRLEEPVSESEALAVGMPSQPWALPLGIGAAVLLGGVVFWQLSSQRVALEDARLTDPAPGVEPGVSLEGVPPPPDLYSLPVEIPPAPPPAVEYIVPPPAPVMENAQTSPELESRLRSPALVVDLTQPAATTEAGGITAASVTQAVGGAPAARNADEDFAARLGVTGSETARAERMDNQAYTVAEGSVIPAVLETAINSDLPGYVRAVVSRDVRSFDGTNVLVPRGSRLVGQYRSGVALGQSRAFVIWTRVIRPDGVSVSLGAPGTDALGRGGLEGRVDRHFLQRFGGAILLSLISAGSALASDSDTQVIIASTSGAATSAASTALESDLSIAPTVHVAQGAPIRVFVTRDLDFSVLGETE